MPQRGELHLEQPRFSLDRPVNLRDPYRGYQAISLAISRLLLSLPSVGPVLAPSARPRAIVCSSEQFDLLKRQKSELRHMYPDDIEEYVLGCTAPVKATLTAEVSAIQAAENKYQSTDVFACLESDELDAERTQIFRNLFWEVPVPPLTEPHKIRMFRTYAPAASLEESLEQFQDKIDRHFLPKVSLGNLEFNISSAASEGALEF